MPSASNTESVKPVSSPIDYKYYCLKYKLPKGYQMKVCMKKLAPKITPGKAKEKPGSRLRMQKQVCSCSAGYSRAMEQKNTDRKQQENIEMIREL